MITGPTMETTIRTCTSESVSSLEPVNAAACDKVPGMAGGGGGGGLVA